MIRLTILTGIATVLMLSTAQADGVRSTTCVGAYGMVSCSTKWQRWEPQAPQPPTEQDLAEIRERERLWQARCQPAIKQDGFGVRRYVYAASGCEYGRFD